VVEKQLRDVIDKLCLVANDEGLLPPSAVEYFSMSCMLYFGSSVELLVYGPALMAYC
jgi:hypothetical protein